MNLADQLAEIGIDSQVLGSRPLGSISHTALRVRGTQKFTATSTGNRSSFGPMSPISNRLGSASRSSGATRTRRRTREQRRVGQGRAVRKTVMRRPGDRVIAIYLK